MNLPNVLTGLRMVLIPLFVWAYYQVDPVLALIIYLLAAATDWLTDFGPKVASGNLLRQTGRPAGR